MAILALSAVVATPAAAEASRPRGGPKVVARSTWDPTGTCPAGAGPTIRPHRIQVHHTVSPTVSKPRDVPAAMRSICRTHQDVNGWSDIAYHYVVDPFGKVWQARGPLLEDLDDRIRMGAHAQGFNDHSIGIVLLGNFEVHEPTRKALRALRNLIAVLALHFDIDPTSSVTAVSGGGWLTRFAAGTAVELPAISGHLDTGLTECPGEHLYEQLPRLRRDVEARMAELHRGPGNDEPGKGRTQKGNDRPAARRGERARKTEPGRPADAEANARPARAAPDPAGPAPSSAERRPEPNPFAWLLLPGLWGFMF